jgi:hypothetical protein
MLKKLTGIITLLIFGTGAYAQQGEETLRPLTGNPTLKEQLQKVKHTGIVRKSGIKDTLLLPFFDDFSGGEVFPKENKWVNKLAYINTDFPVNPPSIGVATLDGLDSTGRPYFNIRPDLHGPCDTLTSQPIDISAYNSANNIYLSFFYQPQGLSFLPLGSGDSLVLQFKTSQGFWYTAWSTPGFALQNFKQAIVKVDSLPYFHSGFQFRFINYMSYIGGVGQWHIDYVYMERNRSVADTVYKDVALSQKPQSFLRYYQEMPYSQYAGFEATENIDSTHSSLSNMDTVGRTVDVFNREIVDESANSIVNAPRSGLAIDPASTVPFGFPSVTAIPIKNTDTSIYTVSEYLRITGANFKRDNDSFARTLTFGNYYAYDDGTAETGYGIKRGAGKVAYKFRTNTTDTLRAISVYYFQAEDTIKRGFTLSVWSNINLNAAGETLVASKAVFYPNYTDSINGYYTYILDSAIAVAGDFYIGWTQTSEFHLNVGWDRNYTLNNDTIPNPNLFFNTTGKWYVSFVPGTLMMRPHLGKDFRVDTTVLHTPKVVNNPKGSIMVYPNPASDMLTVVCPTDGVYNYTVADITGKTIMQGAVNATDGNSLNINSLSNGLYFLILQHPTQGEYRTKFIKH